MENQIHINTGIIPEHTRTCIGASGLAAIKWLMKQPGGMDAINAKINESRNEEQ